MYRDAQVEERGRIVGSMSSARSYERRASSSLPSPRAATPQRHLRLGVVGIDLHRFFQLGARVFVVAAIEIDDGLVQTRLHVFRIQLRRLFGVQEGLLIVASIERDEAQVVPDERTLCVEIRRLLERGLRKIPACHFIVGKAQGVISNDGLRDVFAAHGKQPPRLIERFVQVARLT